MLSSASPHSSDSNNINNGMRAAAGSGDTIGLHEKTSSRGMQYLVKYHKKFNVSTRKTSSPTRTHTLWNKDAQTNEGTTHTRGSMAHVSALGLDLLVYCSMPQQMSVEAMARATEEDRVNTTTYMPGTYDQKNIHPRWKRHPHPHPSCREIRGGYHQIKPLYARNLMTLLALKRKPVSVSACENIT